MAKKGEELKTTVILYSPKDGMKGKARISNTIKKDKFEATIFFDDIEVNEYIENLHKIKFILGDEYVGEIEVEIKNVLDIGCCGDGAIIKARYHAYPESFIAQKEQEMVDAGEITFEEGVKIGIRRSFKSEYAEKQIQILGI